MFFAAMNAAKAKTGMVDTLPLSPTKAEAIPFEEHGHHCLNCGHKVRHNYCECCGQKLALHRLSLTHFLVHDLIHGFFHVDRGIIFTLREVALRPGRFAVAYIRGKRVGKFPVVTLLLILIAILLSMRGIMNKEEMRNIESQLTADNGGQARELGLSLGKKLNDNLKWLLLGTLPISAVSTLWAFRRCKYNYTEHLVINAYTFAGALVWCLALNAIFLASGHPFELFTGYGGWLSMLIFSIGYWQALGSIIPSEALSGAT